MDRDRVLKKMREEKEETRQSVKDESDEEDRGGDSCVDDELKW